MAICIYSTVTINQLITSTVAANSKFKTEIAKAHFLKKYEFWGPFNIKSMVRIMVKSLCVEGLVLENWYLICGQISCSHIATHFHTLTFYRNGVIFEAGWHPPGSYESPDYPLSYDVWWIAMLLQMAVLQPKMLSSFAWPQHYSEIWLYNVY